LWTEFLEAVKAEPMEALRNCGAKDAFVDVATLCSQIQGGVRSIQVYAHDCQHGHCARMTHTKSEIQFRCIFTFMHVKSMDSPQARGSKKRGAVAPVDFATVDVSHLH